MLDGPEFGKSVVEVVRNYMEREVAPLKVENESLKQRIAALEARPLPKEPDTIELKLSVEEIVSAIDFPKQFKELADEIEIKVDEAVDAAVEKAVAAIPTPKDGEPGKDGQDGVAPTLEDVTAALAPEVTALVEQAVAAIPAPKDGEPGKDGQDGVAPTLEDVTVALAPEVTALVEQAVAAIPAPKDGEPGKDGQDGVAPTLEGRNCGSGSRSHSFGGAGCSSYSCAQGWRTG
jgi:hypothetical protein